MTAVTAAKETEHDPALAFAFLIATVARNRQGIDGAVGMRHSTFWISQCSGTEDHIDHAQNGFGVTTHWAWAFCANHQAIWQYEVHGIEHTRIGRHIWKHMLQSHITCGHCCGFGNIHRACALCRCARKIQRQTIALDRHVKRNGQRCVDHPIVVQHIFKTVATIGQAANVRAHQAHCTRAQLDHGLRYSGIAVFIEQAIQTFGAQFQSGQLTIQVAPKAVGQTRVGAQNSQHIFL